MRRFEMVFENNLPATQGRRRQNILRRAMRRTTYNDGGSSEGADAAPTGSYYRIEGTDWKRVAYGDEKDDWGADRQPCRDCAVLRGQLHVPGCDSPSPGIKRPV